MPGLYSINQRSDGETLTAAIYLADHQVHVDNQIPSKMDDLSSNVSDLQAEFDTGDVGTEVLPANLEQEVRALRREIRVIKGTQYFYEDIPLTLVESSAYGAEWYS